MNTHDTEMNGIPGDCRFLGNKQPTRAFIPRGERKMRNPQWSGAGKRLRQECGMVFWIYLDCSELALHVRVGAMMKIWMTATVAGALTVLGAVAANAASVLPTYVPCATGGATIDDPGATYVDCIGPLDGNDTGAGSTLLADLNSGAAFAGYDSVTLGSTWSLVGKTDAGGDPITGGLDVLSGMWSAASGLMSNVVVSVKAGSCYSAYLFTGVTGPSGSGGFDTGLAGLRVGGSSDVDCAGKEVPVVSHVSVFTAGSMSVIPLPAAGWLLLAGVGGLAAMRRKKTA